MSGSSFIIAIDGPAASGKGTLARRLANAFSLAHLDTGMLYRAVGWSLVAAGIEPDDVRAATEAASNLSVADLDNDALRGDVAASAASKVAVMPVVRQALLTFQRRFAAEPPAGAEGAVLDGRDVGTVVCPDAQVKLFITATIEARTARRVRELRQRGLAAIQDAVMAEMRERDERDSRRAYAPLRASEDAVTIDTSCLGPDAVYAAAADVVTVRLADWRAGENGPEAPKYKDDA